MGYALAAIVFLNPIRVGRMEPLSIAAATPVRLGVRKGRCHHERGCELDSTRGRHHGQDQCRQWRTIYGPICGGQMRLIASFPLARRSDGSSITSGSTRSRRTYPRRAGHRCGRNVVIRRRMRGCTLRQQIGTWQRKRHPTLRSISASVGE